ncbi:MAG: hypothetical protein A2Y36_11110, partial [Treponema sp. GWA1_62_8]
MRLRVKFVGIYALIFGSVLSVVGISLATLQRLERIRDTVDKGNSLLVQSRRVRELTKDIMIGAFAPESYANLKDVVYFDPFSAAIRNWKEEARRFQALFANFMDDPQLARMVARGLLGDEHETAMIMSRKAFARINGLVERVEILHATGLLGEEGLYARIQASSDDAMIALFDETRQTSYYLANSFESFLKYFVETLEQEAISVRADLVRSFIVVGLLTAFLATFITLVFSSRIVRRLRTVREAMRRVSAGDFSTPLAFDSADEFEELAGGFNLYMDALKANLAAMVSLARDAAESALAEERDADSGAKVEGAADRVLLSITDAALRDKATSTAQGCAVVRRREGSGFQGAGGGPGAELVALRGVMPIADNAELLSALASVGDDEPPRAFGAFLAGPLGVGGRRFGTLAVWSDAGPYNDLDLIRFSNYLEFASIVADNAAKYGELVELRNAEYLALQSQVQPHFLYNVLGGFAALNRLGERVPLENSIQALKKLLRYAVDHEDETTVEEELAFVESYFRLQKLRFQERLVWTIEATDAARALRIPKLVLQPLVENAVIHGIEEGDGSGFVAVAASVMDGRLLLDVRDDGAGFDASNSRRGVRSDTDRRARRFDAAFVDIRMPNMS